jgi:hypothetical protein
VAFISGILVTVQWIGTDYGMEVYDFVKRPDVVEKIVEVEVVKIVTISDDQDIQLINQEYRDALLKITAVQYSSSSTKGCFQAVQDHAEKGLAVSGIIAKSQSEQ